MAGGARCYRTIAFIRSIATVDITVTEPPITDTITIKNTLELALITCHITTVFLVIASNAVIMSITDPALRYTSTARHVTCVGIRHIGTRYELCWTPYRVAVEFIRPIITIIVTITAP